MEEEAEWQCKDKEDGRRKAREEEKIAGRTPTNPSLISGKEDITMNPRVTRSKRSCLKELDNSESLTKRSRDALGKLLKRVKSHGSRNLNKKDNYICPCNSSGKLENEPEGNHGHCMLHTTLKENRGDDAGSCSKDEMPNIVSEAKREGNFLHPDHDNKNELDESDWEDGLGPTLNPECKSTNGVTVEFDISPDPVKQKHIRRFTAEEKEWAKLVHKAHLLCLLGRGRLIDSACNDPLVQGSVLSIVPAHLLKIAEIQNLTAKDLAPIVHWFHHNFHVKSPGTPEKSFQSALASTIETHEGTIEEITALSVALFRALNLTTRFVSILDVVSLKPDIEQFESTGQGPRDAGTGVFGSSALMVTRPSHPSSVCVNSVSCNDKDDNCESSSSGACKTKSGNSKGCYSESKESSMNTLLKDKILDSLGSETSSDNSSTCLTAKSSSLKRKGDLEFEMQLEMALSATSVGGSRTASESNKVHPPDLFLPLKKIKRIRPDDCAKSSDGISTAVASKKVGAPIYWAEVYCRGENLTGKWVHVDTVNGLIDKEQNVEAAAAACRISLRYVVAFAGCGAKDVTRRYCTKWYKIANSRVNSIWWDAVLAPLKELESGETDSIICFKDEASRRDDEGCQVTTVNSSEKSTSASPEIQVTVKGKRPATLSSSILEDIELETRALTEPLPTNQQAYKNHQLYAIERWLKKYEVLYPKGPVLGFCSGHPVYPRTCVQTLQTKERWLREGLQVKAAELPAKILKRSPKHKKSESGGDDDLTERAHDGTVSLYGRWQTEPLSLPHAVDGIVPKNERGQVDVWSEKCLPPGTIHIRLPRLVPVAKRLGIDFAPAMVGFEFRNGRSFPVFEGIVVCAEYRDAILEAHAEEEERREAETKRRNEEQALTRWYQLLSSIVTRQRLQNTYGDASSSVASIDMPKSGDKGCHAVDIGNRNLDNATPEPTHDHEHIFLLEDQTFNEETLIRTKRCHCGFSIQFEEF